MAKTAGALEAQLVLVFTLLVVTASAIRVGSKVDLVGSDDEIRATVTTTTKSPVEPVVEVHVSVKLPVAKNDSEEKTKEKKKGDGEEVEKDEVPIVVGLKGIASKTEAPDIPVYPGLKLGPEFEAHFPKGSPSPLPPVQEEIPVLMYQDLTPRFHPTMPPRKFHYLRPPPPYPRYRPSVGVAGRRPTLFVPYTPSVRPAIHRNYFPATWGVPPTIIKIDGKLDFES